MDISIHHPRFYPEPHLKKKIKRILIIFAPEEAEIFKDYMFILA